MSTLRNINYNVVRPAHVVGAFLKNAKGNYATVEQLENEQIRVFGKIRRPIVNCIWNLTSDSNHGGAVITKHVVGRKLHAVTLHNPDVLNEKGQVLNTFKQYIAQPEVRNQLETQFAKLQQTIVEAETRALENMTDDNVMLLSDESKSEKKQSLILLSA